jgi:DNA-binding response OmpR family regulator
MKKTPLAPSSKKIIICDDNDDILMYLQTVLTLENYDVKSAHGYDELMPVLKKFKPDLLILDIRMPSMDGFDVLEKMAEQHISVPVFMVTAHDHFMYRNYAPIAGVHEYLPKPIDEDVLLAKIKALFETK